MPGAIASHYAKALVDMVLDPSSDLMPCQAVEQLSSFSSLVHDSSDLRNALMSPAVSRQRKLAVASKLLEALGTHRFIRNFSLVVIRHHRAAEFGEILKAFQILLDERMGIIHADIISAVDLSEQQKRELEEALGEKTKKKIRPAFKIDPSIIGGVTVKIGSEVIDGSLLGQLALLRRRMAGAPLGK